MKVLFILLILGGFAYGGWVFYGQTQSNSPDGRNSSQFKVSNPTLSLNKSDLSISNLESILGASIGSGVEYATSTLSNVTGGASEPIINKAISNFQQELSKLPEDQMKKFQYNYCKSIVEEYEKNH